METIKAGTRCECRDVKCPSCLKHWFDADNTPCRDDAVHLVTVRGEGMDYVELDAPDPNNYGYRAVPMCAPCAEYHEAKGV